LSNVPLFYTREMSVFYLIAAEYSLPETMLLTFV